jgi:hypothetical protein
LFKVVTDGRKGLADRAAAKGCRLDAPVALPPTLEEAKAKACK